MIKKLLIVGSGGHGRCCLDIVRDLKIYASTIDASVYHSYANLLGH